MNVTCDNCQKRYAIADEKVRGKAVVKIRCKQCQHLITLQGLPAEDGAPAGQPAAQVRTPAAPARAPAPAPAPARAPAQAAPAPQAGVGLGDDDAENARTRAMPVMDLSQSWFAMIAKQQVGPLSPRQLEGKVREGQITLRTYMWRQGMDGWKRASDVPELSPLLAGVSVGATATGPTTPALAPAEPARKASLKRDVAVASQQLPMPELTGREPHPATAAAADRDFDVRTDPVQDLAELHAPRPAARTEPAVQRAEPAAGALGALFEDVPQPSREDLGPVAADEPAPTPDDQGTGEGLPGDAGEDPGAEADAGPASDDGGVDAPASDANQDPFALLGGGSDGQLPPPGEATKFFIAQAGVNKRNPPWKIALFVLGLVGLPVGTLYLLSTLRIVPLEVTRTNEQGEQVTESFFSAGGISGLKDLLSGEEKRRRQAAEARRKAADEERRRATAVARVDKPGDPEQRERARPDEELLKNAPRSDLTPEQMAELYRNDPKTGVAGPGGTMPRVRQDDGAKPATDSSSGGLAADVAAKKIGESQAAFQGCIEDALRRNPKLSVGKITLNLTVGSSGTVIRTGLDPKVHEGTDWGKCLRDRGKRITFPAFSGDEEAELQVPLVVGVSVQ